MDMDWSWGAAEREFQRAITLDHNNAGATKHTANISWLGQARRSCCRAEPGKGFRSASWQTHYILARTFSAAGRYDEALQHWRESIALGCPAGYQLHRRMAIAYEGKG